MMGLSLLLTMLITVMASAGLTASASPDINISIFTTFDDRDYFNLMYAIADERKSHPNLSFERMLRYGKKDFYQNDSISSSLLLHNRLRKGLLGT